MRPQTLKTKPISYMIRRLTHHQTAKQLCVLAIALGFLSACDDEETQEKKSNSFLKKILSQKKEEGKREAEALLEQLKGVDDLGDLDLEDPDAEEEDLDEEEKEERRKKAEEKAKEKAKDVPFSGRKKFHKEEADPSKQANMLNS